MREIRVEIPEYDGPSRHEYDVMRERFTALENRLSRVVANAPNSDQLRLSWETVATLFEELASGRKISAIKFLREKCAPMGLKEAKDLIESISDNYVIHRTGYCCACKAGSEFNG